MPKPNPNIYLRDKFSVRPGLVGRFFQGQEDLVAALNDAGVSLIAACGEKSVIEGDSVHGELPQMMHIWKLPKWDTLYNLMYKFSENDWYSREVSSLKIEHQDLLIKVGPGIEVADRPEHWKNQKTPGYVYLYEEIRPNVATTKMQQLRDLNWFQAVVEDEEHGWELIWLGSEITGTPSQTCLLWKVPDVETVDKTLAAVAYHKEPSVRDRYSNMMAGIEALKRKYMYPESTEHIANQLQKPGADETAPTGGKRHERS